MKYLLISIFLLAYSNCLGQEYFSKIIPTLANVLVKNVKLIDNKYVIPTDFFANGGVTGGFLIINQEDVEKVEFDEMDLGLSPILLYDNSIFLVGENPLNQADSTLFLSKIDQNSFEIEWFKEYSCPVVKTVNTTIKRINEHLFIFNVNNAGTDIVNQRELLILKINLDGEAIAKFTYNLDKRTTYGYELLNTHDSHLVLSNLFSSYDQPSRTSSQLIKISQNGEVIWNYEGEELDNGAVPTWATELSDSTILQTYYVDRTQDVDFIVNNWFRRPNKFIWLNKNGELIRDKMIITDREDFLYYAGVKRGLEDYFFAYGYHEDRRPFLLDQFYCHLTKFSNNGDTIWSHNYQHPSYPEGNIIHTIKDILEEENGDITVLADINAPGVKTEVWLFKLNSEGCYINEECEDMSVVTSIQEINSQSNMLYPNPAFGELNISWDTAIKEVSIVDITGKTLKSEKMNDVKVMMDISSLKNGIYIIQIYDETGKVTSKRIVKL